MRLLVLHVWFFASIGNAACQHAATPEGPAVFKNSSPASLDAFEDELLSALNKRGWRLDLSDVPETSRMMVRPLGPDPNNMHNFDEPIQLELRHRGDACFVIHPDTGAEISLNSVTCEPAS